MVLTYLSTHIYKLWCCHIIGSLHLNKTKYTVYVYPYVFVQVKPICDLLCREKQFFCTIWQVWLSFGTFHSLSVKFTSETVRDRRKSSTNNSKLKTKYYKKN